MKNDPLFKTGDVVRLTVLPPWVDQLLEESRAVIRFCVGKTFTVFEVNEHGHLGLDVSAVVDPVFGGFMNSIWVEPEYVTQGGT